MVFRNEDIRRVVVAIPEGHRHVRTIIETSKGETFTFQEATIAGIVRAYVDIKTHPEIHAVELVRREIPDRKKGYTRHQLLETDADEGALRREIAGER